ncbi:MAG TPA: S41 family peptidase [Candidatus Saccharimonadales bacterium]|nr:S41 family peptidase [Candidatus Saccharimonadales bacterium]
MKRRFLLIFLCSLASHMAIANESLDLKEVMDLVRSNLAGAKDEEINRAAVQGLISQLAPRVSLVGTSADTTNVPSQKAVLSSTVYDSNYGYLRVGQMNAGSDEKILEACRGLLSSNQIKGLVFDLRYASGQDYPAALALADAFFSSEKPLMDYGDGMKKSAAKRDSIQLPLTLLVNGNTAGAPEAFVGALQQAGVGLVLGSRTAGMASIAREFPLKNGQKLRIATTPIKLGDGASFPQDGLKPDIQIEIPAEEEKVYFTDAFKVLPKTNQVVAASSTSGKTSTTNRPPRHRMNEAELVRMTREGQNPDAEVASASRDAEPPRLLIHDPALARAIDLLKGLAVVQRPRST